MGQAGKAPATIHFRGKDYLVGRRDCEVTPYVLRGPRGGAIELVRNLKSGLLLPVYVGRGRTPTRTIDGAFTDEGPDGLREVV